MGRVTVDIKEWVANGRFEGEQKLHNREGEISNTASLESNPLIFFSSSLLFFLSFYFYFLFCTSFLPLFFSFLFFFSLLSITIVFSTTSLASLLHFILTKGNISNSANITIFIPHNFQLLSVKFKI
jgi:hypothetical protein